MANDQEFIVSVKLGDADETKQLKVRHVDETFEFEVNGEDVSILNNGDNSWDLVKGKLDQLSVNEIGIAIEESGY